MNDIEFQRLTTLYLEGALEENELEKLGHELDRSPARVRQFNDVRLLTGLIHEHGQNTSELEFPSPASKSVTSHGWTRSRWLFLAAQGSIAATLLFAIMFLPSLFAPSPVATLVSGENVSWESSLPTAMGSDLVPGTLDLKTGIAIIQFRSGAAVTLQGPASLELLTSMRGRMLAGKARIDVPDSAIGFIMETPNGYAVDHGTEFSVSVDPSANRSSFKVLEGEISVFVASTGENALLTGEGKAVTVEADSLVKGTPVEPELGPDPGPKMLIIGTNGREGSAIRNDRRKYIQPKYLTVNRLFNRAWDRRSFFAFDLSNVDLEKAKSVSLRLNLVPFPYGFFSSLPELNQYAVYGITNDQKTDWEIECSWQDSPGPDDGIHIGTFDVPRSQQQGSFAISNEKLLQFLIERGKTEVTFVIVRENMPIKNNDVPCHAFAGRPHPEANGPQLEFALSKTGNRASPTTSTPVASSPNE
ncbi:FecR domain-containing protein [Rhodopirellula sp. SWK7]|uniref:FecR domain-containing protein n=1 Tax=Rhodopirellula sp. SWK7 TaxID=595460 RepID=UPI0002BE7EDA|nr:FecR domain-containing protein [Rhodopirellula sp. SWK7]EMI41329.1 FecR protein domain protein [Rhodopirellula sp. SWK7]